MRPLRPLPPSCSRGSRYAEARTSTSAVDAAQCVGGSMATSLFAASGGGEGREGGAWREGWGRVGRGERRGAGVGGSRQGFTPEPTSSRPGSRTAPHTDADEAATTVTGSAECHDDQAAMSRAPMSSRRLGEAWERRTILLAKPEGPGDAAKRGQGASGNLSAACP